MCTCSTTSECTRHSKIAWMHPKYGYKTNQAWKVIRNPFSLARNLLQCWYNKNAAKCLASKGSADWHCVKEDCSGLLRIIFEGDVQALLISFIKVSAWGWVGFHSDRQELVICGQSGRCMRLAEKWKFVYEKHTIHAFNVQLASRMCQKEGGAKKKSVSTRHFPWVGPTTLIWCKWCNYLFSFQQMVSEKRCLTVRKCLHKYITTN